MLLATSGWDRCTRLIELEILDAEPFVVPKHRTRVSEADKMYAADIALLTPQTGQVDASQTVLLASGGDNNEVSLQRPSFCQPGQIR